MKKDELIQKVEELEQENKMLIEKIEIEQRTHNMEKEYLRKQFSKVLNKYDDGLDIHNIYHRAKEMILSWQEIFFEIGKLDAWSDYEDLKEENEELKSKLRELSGKDKQCCL